VPKKELNDARPQGAVPLLSKGRLSRAALFFPRRTCVCDGELIRRPPRSASRSSAPSLIAPYSRTPSRQSEREGHRRA
jgi:hypothetical protein